MSQILGTVAVIGIDIGKNSFCVVGLEGDGALVLRQKWSGGQVEARLANMPTCLIGMEASVGHISSAACEFACAGASISNTSTARA